ncbi:cyclic pyranopterin monophosphate synthase MoaC [Thermodesulfobacteriota bacterium]
MNEFTHFDDSGRAHMVDVSDKNITKRVAKACAKITMTGETFKKIFNQGIKKGDVLGTAQIAGIMGAKLTPQIIPMCHPLNINGVNVEYEPDESASSIKIIATVKVDGKTGVEMEALTAASIAALTIYDMCKAVDKGMVISDVMLLSKTGGKSGEFKRD